MNSFDVFDTLIARRYISSDIIWEVIEEKFKIQNFKKERISSDNGQRSFDEIYIDLYNKKIITDLNILKNVKEFEIRLEIENSFAIQKNLDLINHGDLLISDMYLNAPTILNLVRSCGLDKQVSIYQSNGDKGNGKVWLDLINDKPDLHIGDNRHTDNAKPSEFGFKTALFTGSELNECEKFLFNSKLNNLALLCREIRLKNNPKNNENFFDISNQLNLPFLFVCCELLFRDLQDKNITFLGRDCQLLWAIYNSFYKNSFYTPFSREVAFNQPELSIQYLLNNSYKEDNVFVDISSGGNTWGFLNKFAKLNTKAIIFSDGSMPVFDIPETFTYVTKNSECGETNSLLEIFNCGDHGRIKFLKKITDKIILTEYAEKEILPEIIKAIHEPIKQSVMLKDIYSFNIRRELSNKTQEELMKLFIVFSSNICNQKHIYNHLPSFEKIEGDYFREIQQLHQNAKSN